MTFKKPVLISRQEPSSWKSCQSIVANLDAAYSKFLCDGSLTRLYLPGELNDYQAYKAIEQLKEIEPDLIIWIDHAPCPALFIKELNRFYGKNERPYLLIHLFGDFVIDCLKWQNVEDELKEWRVHFVAASDRQQKLIQQFISKDDQVSSLPFPVDTHFFTLDMGAEKRFAIRAKMKVESDVKIFLYTGRVSYQKNIELLLKSFNALEKVWHDKVQLWIAGPVDDILLPYRGKHGLPGSFFLHLSHNTNLFSNRIHYLGNLSSEELKEVYSAADVFLSPSTYNDEDFGMSPAEALCMGLECVLSDWGGYTSFKKFCSEIELVKVAIDDERAVVDSKDWQKILSRKMFETNADYEKRVARAQNAARSLSIEAVGMKLNEEISSLNFSPVHFSKKFLEMCDAFRNDKFAPFKNLSTYKEIYSVYCD